MKPSNESPLTHGVRLNQGVYSEPSRYLEVLRGQLLSHPIACRGRSGFASYTSSTPSAGSSSTEPHLMPRISAEFDISGARAYLTENEYEEKHRRIETCHPELAAVIASRITLEGNMDDMYHDSSYTYEIAISKFLDIPALRCGPVLPMSVFYATTLCVTLEHVRENLSSYFSVLVEKCPCIEILLMQQIGTNTILSNTSYPKLAQIFDELRIFSSYLKLRSDSEDLLNSNAVFIKANQSFQSLTKEEVAFISSEAQANALAKMNQDFYYSVPVSEGNGVLSPLECSLILSMASALALCQGESQMQIAEGMLKQDRLFGLTTISLLTSPWYEEQVRAAALRCMAREEPIVGREMAKIVLVLDKSPLLLDTARSIVPDFGGERLSRRDLS